MMAHARLAVDVGRSNTPCTRAGDVKKYYIRATCEFLILLATHAESEKG